VIISINIILGKLKRKKDIEEGRKEAEAFIKVTNLFLSFSTIISI
jgi:hypothetical protein